MRFRSLILPVVAIVLIALVGAMWHAGYLENGAAGLMVTAALMPFGFVGITAGEQAATEAKSIHQDMQAKISELEVLQGKVADLEKADEPDADALKAAQEAYEAKTQEFEALKPKLQQAKAHLARYNMLREAEELAHQTTVNRRGITPPYQVDAPAEPTDHNARGKAHTEAFMKWAQGKSVSDREYDNLLIPSDPRKRENAEGMVIMPRPLAGVIIGGAKGKAMLSSATSEGYTVPTEDIEELLRLPVEQATVYERVRKLQLRNNVAYIPRLKQADRTTSGDGTPGINDGDLAGVEITLGRSEGNQYTETEAEFEQVTLNTYSLDAKTEVSAEFKRRSFLDISAFVNEMFVLGMRNAFDWLILNGSGSSQATGIRSDSNVKTVNRNTVGTVKAVDLTSMEFGILPQYRNRSCVYVLSDDAFEALRKLEDSDGYPVLTRSYQGGMVDRLNGFDFIATTRLPDAGADGDMIFMNPRAYGFAVEEEMMIGKSEHEKFSYGKTVYAVRAWVGGIPILPRAICELQNEAS